MQRFIGIDLAWSYRNTSGIFALECKDNKIFQLTYNNSIKKDDEILDFIQANKGKGGCLVAIDAPLVVPNVKGTRPVDIEITKRFHSQEAGTLPANRNILKNNKGEVRGEVLVEKLEKIGCEHSFEIKKHDRGFKVFEVFPHPAMVVIFDLSTILKYKAKKGRTLNFRLKELDRYKTYLSNLQKFVPPLAQPPPLQDCRDTACRVPTKCYEDLLDALFCAWLASYFWYWGPQGFEVVGDMQNGYIVLPKMAGFPACHCDP
ncbi:MAG: DUF429 domain-containing protein [bacterium]|nr:DUF429 domain-containing protein [bacterium]